MSNFIQQHENDYDRLRLATQQSSQSINENDIDQIVNQHMRDITAENRPQMSNAGLEINNKHFKDLNNHELHQIKKMYMKDHKNKKNNILNESLETIADKSINFLTYAFDDYIESYYKAELLDDSYDNDNKSLYQKIKIHLISFVIFLKTSDNILYLGIILILISMIIYLIDILTI